MKYRIVKEDPILEYRNITQLAKLVGCSPSLLCRARKGQRTLSEDMYKRLKKIISEEK